MSACCPFDLKTLFQEYDPSYFEVLINLVALQGNQPIDTILKSPKKVVVKYFEFLEEQKQF